MIKYIAIILFSLSLMSCSYPKCINIAYYDYGDVYLLKHVYWFQGEIYKNDFLHDRGLVIVKRYLGEDPNHKDMTCKNPSTYIGYCDIIINEGEGSWILHGMCDGSEVDISPNIIRQRNLKNLIDEFEAKQNKCI
jgi:hypothetical protein